MESTKAITVIIPFLNEGSEVGETIKSIKSHATIPFDIIMINDASTDNYDYEKIAQTYNCVYRAHKTRMGVASSRDEGVLLAQTEYVLMLDAHMRVYQDDWLEKMLSHLKELPEDLLCAATIALDFDGNRISKDIGCGAYWDFDTMSIFWNYKNIDKREQRKRVEVPCLLGASYACRREYWLKLKGLEGLSSYGLDEQMMCLKNWTMGGKSYVALDIEFGHKFRNASNVPYFKTPEDFLRNILLIAELFYSAQYQSALYSIFAESHGNDFILRQVSDLEINKERILSTKQYFKENTVRTFSELIEYNSNFIKSWN
ncbi:glycosyltransferase family 2 protein [Hoylesella timonensis]|uniref:glycosyltransferase family 2 protein n=1 Tax=Hoylesella timonensis TaxID=386414 RepID=UPI00243028E8|nr:glycosyltransferase family 2 protein [Hoylesella timonensis]